MRRVEIAWTAAIAMAFICWFAEQYDYTHLYIVTSLLVASMPEAK